LNPTTTYYKVRVSQRVLAHMEGSQAWADSRACRVPDNDPLLDDLIKQLRFNPSRSDGSTTIHVLPEAAALLAGYAGALEAGAADNVASDMAYGDRSSLAELNAARALLRSLRKIPGAVKW